MPHLHLREKALSKTTGVGASVLLAAPLIATITNIVLPTISDEAPDRVAALSAHHMPMITGMTLEVISIVLMIGGVIWLAGALRPRTPRLALAGGVLGVIGGLVVLFEDGIAATAPAIVHTLPAAQATSVLDHVHSGALAAIEPLSLLLDIGLACLGAAAVKAGAPAWLGAAVAVSAVGQGIGLATGTRALAVAAFAALFLSLAGVVRVLARSGSSPLPSPAMSAA